MFANAENLHISGLGQFKMNSTISTAALLCVIATSAIAMPRALDADVSSSQNELLITVATAAQKNAARADCRKRYGKRLIEVTFTKTQYNCRYQAAGGGSPNKDWLASADKKCREQGMRFMKIISNGKGHSNIMCVR